MRRITPLLSPLPLPLGLVLILAVLSKPSPLQATHPPYTCAQLIQSAAEGETPHPPEDSSKILSASHRFPQKTLNLDPDSSKEQNSSIHLSDLPQQLINGQLNGRAWQKTIDKTETEGKEAPSTQPPTGLIEPPGQANLRELSASSPSQTLELLSRLYSADYTFSEQEPELMAKFMDEIVKKLNGFNKSQLMELVFWLDSLDMAFNARFIREWRKQAKAIKRQFNSYDRYWLYSIFRKRGISPEKAHASILLKTP